MPIRFDLKRDPTAGLVPVGVHRFVVEAAEEKMGPKGEYLNIRLKVYVNGVKWGSSVFEVLSTSDDAKYKVDEFFDAVGAGEEGSAGAAWFVNKSGWAKFERKADNNAVLRTRVQHYLTNEQAEEALSKLADMADGQESVSSAIPVAAAASSGRRASVRKAAVAEMNETDDNSPF